MSRLKSSCARSACTMSSGFGGWVMSGHRVGPLEVVAPPFAGVQHLAQVLHGVPRILEAQVQRREAEAQDVRLPGAEVADDTARYQRLHDGVGAFVAREADLRSASGMRPWRCEAEAVSAAAF